jgi:hypothetical protein
MALDCWRGGAAVCTACVCAANDCIHFYTLRFDVGGSFDHMWVMHAGPVRFRIVTIQWL